jgi:hypothetical protein
MLLSLDLHRRHELQILLRLEMILCDEGHLFEQKTKDQFVKEVCSLLDTIQFHLDGGIFGGKSLSLYCSQLLVSRYITALIILSPPLVATDGLLCMVCL